MYVDLDRRFRGKMTYHWCFVRSWLFTNILVFTGVNDRFGYVKDYIVYIVWLTNEIAIHDTIRELRLFKYERSRNELWDLLIISCFKRAKNNKHIGYIKIQGIRETVWVAENPISLRNNHRKSACVSVALRKISRRKRNSFFARLENGIDNGILFEKIATEPARVCRRANDKRKQREWERKSTELGAVFPVRQTRVCPG